MHACSLAVVLQWKNPWKAALTSQHLFKQLESVQFPKAVVFRDTSTSGCRGAINEYHLTSEEALSSLWLVCGLQLVTKTYYDFFFFFLPPCLQHGADGRNNLRLDGPPSLLKRRIWSVCCMELLGLPAQPHCSLASCLVGRLGTLNLGGERGNTTVAGGSPCCYSVGYGSVGKLYEQGIKMCIAFQLWDAQVSLISVIWECCSANRSSVCWREIHVF